MTKKDPDKPKLRDLFKKEVKNPPKIVDVDKEHEKVVKARSSCPHWLAGHCVADCTICTGAS